METLDREVERILQAAKDEVINEYLTYREFYKDHPKKLAYFERVPGRFLFLKRRIIFEQRMALMYRFNALEVKLAEAYKLWDTDLRLDYESLEQDMRAWGYLKTKNKPRDDEL